MATRAVSLRLAAATAVAAAAGGGGGGAGARAGAACGGIGAAALLAPCAAAAAVGVTAAAGWAPGGARAMASSRTASARRRSKARSHVDLVLLELRRRDRGAAAELEEAAAGVFGAYYNPTHVRTGRKELTKLMLEDKITSWYAKVSMKHDPMFMSPDYEEYVAAAGAALCSERPRAPWRPSQSLTVARSRLAPRLSSAVAALTANWRRWKSADDRANLGASSPRRRSARRASLASLRAAPTYHQLMVLFFVRHHPCELTIVITPKLEGDGDLGAVNAARCALLRGACASSPASRLAVPAGSTELQRVGCGTSLLPGRPLGSPPPPPGPRACRAPCATSSPPESPPAALTPAAGACGAQRWLPLARSPSYAVPTRAHRLRCFPTQPLLMSEKLFFGSTVRIHHFARRTLVERARRSSGHFPAPPDARTHSRSAMHRATPRGTSTTSDAPAQHVARPRGFWPTNEQMASVRCFKLRHLRRWRARGSMHGGLR